MHGYSSSEESEDPRRPTAQPATNNNNDQKKKKKRRVPPQQSINRIWKKFSNRKFHKALAVLPFDPVKPPADSNRPNALLDDGHERAAEECQRKVQKIVKECRRLNKRYRDPGWDIDWDLKYEKGYCLNTLALQKYDLSGANLLKSTSSVPKAVKRVHEIFEKPTFMSNVNGGDVKQGSLGDCWIMAAMTALANVEGGIQRSCVAHDTKIGIYGFVFYRDGEWIYSIIDDKLYLKSPCWDSPSMQRDLLQQIDREDVENVYRKTYQTGSKALFFAQCRDQNETWVPLMEKAYAKAHGDYASLSGGMIGEGLEDLSGGVTTELLTSDILDLDEFWDSEMSKVNREFMFGCSTGLLEHGYGSRDGISEGHAYIVMDARTISTGQRLVKLRNPWGKIRKGIWEGAWSDGSKEWTTDVQEELGHRFGGDSVFWISYEDLIRKYTLFDRTRLFRDEEWRCCQRWIGVDVPWKPEYHEKFQVKLAQDSPLVLVLSQLDGRYFKGLQGQYSFRLHFRIHDQNELNAEDYIVRSQGNYLMHRSVSVELPDMPAGTYIVYLKVTAERDAAAKSVEQVVKRECLQRVENEKLAQVGFAYDLAHSKAWDHMDKVAKLRKKRDQEKATTCRQQQRRKNWERRHFNRTAVKVQGEKNKKKKSDCRAAWEEEQQKLEQRKREEQEAKAQEVAEKAKAADARRVADIPPTAEKSEEADTVPQPEDGKDAEEKSPEDTVDDASDSTGSPHLTPKSDDSNIVESEAEKQEVPPASSPPPAPAPAQPEPAAVGQRPAYDSAGDSSDSPVEEWEELYSSDDMTRKLRIAPQPVPQPRDDYDTEEERMPDPWNAVCIVGIRVYSKDTGLELRTVMEGDELLEDGMGEKGAADLDNAQANAGGVRANGDKTGAVAVAEGTTVPYPPVVRRDGDNMTAVGKPSDGHSSIAAYIYIDSADSTPTATPQPTDGGAEKRLEKTG